MNKKEDFFRVRVLLSRYVGFCKKISMRRQKIITFKKKFIKKYLFVDEIGHFREQKMQYFSKNPEIFQWEINGN